MCGGVTCELCDGVVCSVIEIKSRNNFIRQNNQKIFLNLLFSTQRFFRMFNFRIVVFSQEPQLKPS